MSCKFKLSNVIEIEFKNYFYISILENQDLAKLLSLLKVFYLILRISRNIFLILSISRITSSILSVLYIILYSPNTS